MAKRRKNQKPDLKPEDFYDMLGKMSADQIEFLEQLLNEVNSMSAQGKTDKEICDILGQKYGLLDGDESPVGKLPRRITLAPVGITPCTIQSKAQHFCRRREQSGNYRPGTTNEDELVNEIRVYREFRRMVYLNEKSRDKVRTPRGMKRYQNKVPFDLGCCAECARGVLWAYYGYGRYDFLGFPNVKEAPDRELIDAFDKWLEKLGK